MHSFRITQSMKLRKLFFCNISVCVNLVLKVTLPRNTTKVVCMIVKVSIYSMSSVPIFFLTFDRDEMLKHSVSAF